MSHINLPLIMLGVVLLFIYLELLARAFIRYIKYRQRLDIIRILGLKALPFLCIWGIFSVNSSYITLMSFTLGVTFGFMLFLGYHLKRRLLLNMFGKGGKGV